MFGWWLSHTPYIPDIVGQDVLCVPLHWLRRSDHHQERKSTSWLQVISSIKCWNVWVTFFRLKLMNGHSYKPKMLLWLFFQCLLCHLYLIIASDYINLWKYHFILEQLCKIMYVCNWVYMLSWCILVRMFRTRYLPHGCQSS